MYCTVKYNNFLGSRYLLKKRNRNNFVGLENMKPVESEWLWIENELKQSYD